MGKNKFFGLLIKIIFIASLTAGGIFFFRGKKTKLPSTASDVLGETRQYLINTASESASKVENLFIQEVVNKVMDQVNKLPDKEKEEIKREICK